MSSTIVTDEGSEERRQQAIKRAQEQGVNVEEFTSWLEGQFDCVGEQFKAFAEILNKTPMASE